jgi:hypothetical protein
VSLRSRVARARRDRERQILHPPTRDRERTRRIRQAGRGQVQADAFLTPDDHSMAISTHLAWAKWGLR